MIDKSTRENSGEFPLPIFMFSPVIMIMNLRLLARNFLKHCYFVAKFIIHISFRIVRHNDSVELNNKM